MFVSLCRTCWLARAGGRGDVTPSDDSRLTLLILKVKLR